MLNSYFTCDITLKEGEKILEYAEELKHDYKLEVVEIFRYNGTNKYHIKAKGSIFKIIKLTKEIFREVKTDNKCVVDVYR